MYVAGLEQSQSLFFNVESTLFNKLYIQRLSFTKAQSNPRVKREPKQLHQDTINCLTELILIQRKIHFIEYMT